MTPESTGHILGMTPSTEFTTLERGDGRIECSMVPRDSETFEFPVAMISRIELGSGPGENELMRAFDRWCADRNVRLVSCRIDHLQLRESMALETHGFRFVEMVYRPSLSKFDAIGQPRDVIAVAEALPVDIDAIEHVASTAFTTGRYLLDWRLPPELSHRRYARWVRNCLDAPEQTILKAEIEGVLVGFFIVERHSDRTMYWHLTAIAPAFQGRGLGLSLWQTILRRHREEGVTRVQTTVSAHNPAVINLYARLGFSFQSPEVTFHWLRDMPT